MGTEEHFSKLKKDIKSKFISEDQIPEEERNSIIPTQVNKFDPRPLWQILKEQEQQKEDEMNEMYRLANRIRKLDEDEVAFYDQLNLEKRDKLKSIKTKENEELEKFRIDAEARIANIDGLYKSKPLKRTREENDNKKPIVLVKKRVFDQNSTIGIIKQKDSGKTKSIVPLYSSDSDD